MLGGSSLLSLLEGWECMLNIVKSLRPHADIHLVIPYAEEEASPYGFKITGVTALIHRREPSSSQKVNMLIWLPTAPGPGRFQPIRSGTVLVV